MEHCRYSRRVPQSPVDNLAVRLHANVVGKMVLPRSGLGLRVGVLASVISEGDVLVDTNGVSGIGQTTVLGPRALARFLEVGV